MCLYFFVGKVHQNHFRPFTKKEGGIAPIPIKRGVRRRQP